MYGIPAQSIGENVGATERKLHEKLIDSAKQNQSHEFYNQLHQLRTEMSIAAKFFADQIDQQNTKIESLEKTIKDMQEPKTGVASIHVFSANRNDTCAESPPDVQKSDPRKR